MKKTVLFLLLLFGLSCEGLPQFEIDSYTGFRKNLSWADMDLNNDGVGENYVTSIKNQPCSDCFIYSAVGLLEIQYHIDHGINVSLNLSEQNIHNCMKISCSDTGDARTILDYIQRFGVLEEYYVESGDWGKCENCSVYLSTKTGNTYISHIPFYKFKSWKPVTNSSMTYAQRKIALVTALQTGPVIAYAAWGFKADGNIRYCVNDGKAGGHAIIIVGYINNGEAFLVKNSHDEGEFLRLVFDGADKCAFAEIAVQITPNSTYVEWGSGESFCYSTDDFDGDSIPDAHDNCPWDKNLDQKNTDGDMFGDVCDPCPNDRGASGYYCAPKTQTIYNQTTPDGSIIMPDSAIKEIQ